MTFYRKLTAPGSIPYRDTWWAAVRCWLFGHGPFYQRYLRETPALYYGGAPRDGAGRALSWPTCSRCGWMVVTMEVRS